MITHLIHCLVKGFCEVGNIKVCKDKKEEKKALKKQFRWLILKRNGNLSDKNKEHLEQLKGKNEPLYEMYLLKEGFLDIFQKGRTRNEGDEMIKAWTDDILKLKYKKLKNVARTVLKRLDTIINWFDHLLPVI